MRQVVYVLQSKFSKICQIHSTHTYIYACTCHKIPFNPFMPGKFRALFILKKTRDFLKSVLNVF